jgi:hypothetical protein
VSSSRRKYEIIGKYFIANNANMELKNVNPNGDNVVAISSQCAVHTVVGALHERKLHSRRVTQPGVLLLLLLAISSGDNIKSLIFKNCEI